MKKQSVWITDDGHSFKSQAEAQAHEFTEALANELIMQLRFTTQTADQVARNLKEINKIAAQLRKELKETVEDSA